MLPWLQEPVRYVAMVTGAGTHRIGDCKEA